MRVGMKRKICFKILYFKKIMAIFIIAAMAAVMLSGFFTRIYKPYIESLAIGHANYIMHKIINETVLEVLKLEKYDSFVSIIRDSEEKIIGIETDTVKINMFKSAFVRDIAKKMKSIENERFTIPVLAFLNNPFLSEKGPAVAINVRSVGSLTADLESSFISVGVNQTKHQIDLKCKTEIVIVMPAMQIKHLVTTTVPVAQTVVVGEVPQSYTNVTTSTEKLDDTVLQLAGN